MKMKYKFLFINSCLFPLDISTEKFSLQIFSQRSAENHPSPLEI